MNPDATNNQLFALDLTVPLWETSSPPWRYLTAPSVSQSPRFLDRNTMVMSPDESQILLFDRNFPYLATYNVTSDSWLSKQNLPLSFAYGSNYTTAMDPASGVVFLGRGGENGTMMMVYNTTNHNSWTQHMPPSTQLSTYIQGYSFVYCASRKSILLFGGKSFSFQGDVYNPFVFEFQMGAYSWIRLVSLLLSMFSCCQRRRSHHGDFFTFLMHALNFCHNRTRRVRRQHKYTPTAWFLHMTGSRWWCLGDRSRTISN